jgi:hypothetical protein
MSEHADNSTQFLCCLYPPKKRLTRPLRVELVSTSGGGVQRALGEGSGEGILRSTYYNQSNLHHSHLSPRCPDVCICLDANFQHRQYARLEDGPRLLEESDEFGWVLDGEVLAAQKHVEECRTREERTTHTRASLSIPKRVLDTCESSYKASQEKLKQDESVYAVKGIMALVCSHDIPLLLCNVKGFGEPRYLAVALLRKLATMLPPQATLGVMYDIACQLDRTIGVVRVDILDSLFASLLSKHNVMPELANRCSFALALFHAFGHGMECQVVYNPRYRIGFGLTNGEGNERVWSLCRNLIAPERVMGVGYLCRVLNLAELFGRDIGVCLHYLARWSTSPRKNKPYILLITAR